MWISGKRWNVSLITGESLIERGTVLDTFKSLFRQYFTLYLSWHKAFCQVYCYFEQSALFFSKLFLPYRQLHSLYNFQKGSWSTGTTIYLYISNHHISVTEFSLQLFALESMSSAVCHFCPILVLWKNCQLESSSLCDVLINQERKIYFSVYVKALAN